jgi:hypothetical protein
MMAPRLMASLRVEWFAEPTALLIFDLLMNVSDSSEP